jgi:hypothetical protein
MLTEALKPPSLTLRIGLGKLIGFVIGALGFVFLPFIAPESSMMLRMGFLLWYTTLGAIIGVFGVYNHHPVINLPLPWWVRAPLIAGWMNFVLVLFAYDQFAYLMQAVTVWGSTLGMGTLTSPYWFIGEGVLIGLLMGWACTRIGGEGRELMLETTR